MPWKSKAQQGWGHSKEGEKALGGKKSVAEWDSATNFKSLPNKVSKPKSKLGTAIKKAGKKEYK